MSRSVVVAGTLFALAAAAGPAAAQVLYDSGSFAPPRFAAGDLAGQDAGFGPWQRFGAGTASTAVVQTGVTAGGAPAVELTRAAFDNSWWGVMTPRAGVSRVAVRWDMRVSHAAAQGQTYGPFFGVDAFGSGGRIGMLGVDSFTGQVLYCDPVSGLQPPLPITSVSFDAFHAFELVLDYDGLGGGTYRAFVDGSQLPISNSTAASPFVNSPTAGLQLPNNDFTRALITGLPAFGNLADQAATGTGVKVTL
jgi:hypothetical protein